MRSWLRSLLALPLLLMAPAAYGEGVLERATSRGELVAAAVPDELPLAARDASGALTGFDIAVAREIAKRLGLPLTFATPGWDAILAGDWKGEWDFSVSSITPTEGRARTLDFPQVYRFDAAVVLVHKDNTSVMQPRDVSGKRIGVKAGTTFEKYLKHDLTISEGDDAPTYLIDDPTIQTYADKDLAVKALSEGDGTVIDAVVTSFAPARSAIDGGAPVRIVPGFLFWEPVAVAVDKGDEAFARKIAETVDAMMADGTLNALSLEWFGIDMTDPMMR